MLFAPRALVAASALTLTVGLAGCTSDTATTSNGAASADPNGYGPIALLLPESKTARYEKADRPFFTNKIGEICSACTIDYKNANQSESTQLQQAEQALTAGAKVLVLDPVNGETARAIVDRAKQKNVPVVSYDRLVSNADIDYYISFDNEEVGRLQGQALLDKLTKDNKLSAGKIVMINGSPTDNNAKLFKQGAHSVLDGKVEIGKEYDTPEWSPSKAQDEMDQAITALGKQNIVGVYAANDGTAGGAYASMKNASISPIPPLTGQDAETAGLQRVLLDRQYMTVYKAIKPEAEKAAEMAVALIRGQEVQGADRTVNNGSKDVKSVLLTPVAVTKENINDTVVKDGFVTPAELCTGEFKAACTTLGIA